ncbi:hypothetical protein GCM10022199_24980 [Marihabitans asiaticum]|uniref:Lysophospholipase L1-like esterase n=1 Tax=Marihabitans asiaticum TaxID=415218 RepID=A0A560W9J9_9MICO|nr:SGNH/GDSL hydrolase family protein [Marihabitans asiaticum]TWD14282.1 lysophospholipase L1-like esterase [Marihabitans asiaticum]
MHRRIHAALITALCALLVALVGPAPASAEPAQDGPWYLALGDSYAAGYQPGEGDDLTGGYAGEVREALAETAAGARLENLACSGERIGTLLDGGPYCAYEGSQRDAAMAFLAEHPDTALITLDIGGNDVQTCVERSTGAIDLPCLQEGLATIQTRLPELLSDLRAAAPDAQIVITNYPDVFLAAWLTGPAGQDVARLSVTLSESLDQIYAGAAAAAGADFADVGDAFRTRDFEPVVQDPTYGEIPVNVERICTLTWMCSRGDIHPNDAGYSLIASVIAPLLEPVQASPSPTPTTSSPTPSTDPTPGEGTTTSQVPGEPSASADPQRPAAVQTDGGSSPHVALVVALLALVGAALLGAAGRVRRRSGASH